MKLRGCLLRPGPCFIQGLCRMGGAKKEAICGEGYQTRDIFAAWCFLLGSLTVY
jgi:hypothetical protein